MIWVELPQQPEVPPTRALFFFRWLGVEVMGGGDGKKKGD